jgi:glucokinase
MIVGATLTYRATELVIALADPKRRNMPHRVSSRSPAPMSPGEVVERIATAAQGTSEALTGIALAIEGAHIVENGRVTDLSPLPGWQSIWLRDMLSERLAGVPVQLVTIAQAALVAEMNEGAGKSHSWVAYFDTDRAITTAFWHNQLQSHLLQGWYVGDIGHMPIISGGIRCGCGGFGHLNTIATAQAISREMIGRLVEFPATEAAVMQLTGGRAEAITASQIWHLVCEGDTIASQIMDEAQNALAVAIAFLLVTLDVQTIIIGGPLAFCGETWLAALRDSIAKLSPPDRATNFAERVFLARRGMDASIEGALALALAP